MNLFIPDEMNLIFLLVRITFSDVVGTESDVKPKFQFREDITITATDKGTDVTHVIKGSYYVPDQYHFTMETQSCTVSPTRRGVCVRSATQWMDLVQTAVSRTLDLSLNR